MRNYIGKAKWSKVAFIVNIASFIEVRRLDCNAITGLYYRLKNATEAELDDIEVLESALDDYIEDNASLHTPEYMN
jgi:hypothetical protein